MGKTRNTGKLATQIQFDNSNNLVIGTSTSSSFNTSGSVNAIGGITGSIFGIGDPTSFSASISSNLVSIQSVTASNIARLSNLESKSSSVDISVSSINTFTSSNTNTSLNSKTGSYATTGSNTFFGTQTYSGSVYIANDLIVQGSSSIQYISASSVSIGTNIVQLNTANPSVRFAGLTIIDSGSVGGSGSFLYDSLQDEFIFVHRGNGTNVTSSHFVLGPETYDSLGNETYLTTNTIPKGTGKEHLVDSCIFDNGTTTCIKNNLIGTGTISGTTIYGSTITCSPIGCFATSCATSFIGGTMSGTTIYGSTAFCSPVGKFTSCIDVGSGMFSSGVTAASFEVGNGQYYAARRSSGNLLINLLGIESGTDNTRLVSTGDFNIVNGGLSSQFKIASTGIATFACQLCAPRITLNSGTSGTIDLGQISNGAVANQIIGGQWSGYAYTGRLSFKVGTWGANTDYGPTEQMFIEVQGADSKRVSMGMAINGGYVGIGNSAPSHILDITDCIGRGMRLNSGYDQGDLLMITNKLESGRITINNNCPIATFRICKGAGSASSASYSTIAGNMYITFGLRYDGGYNTIQSIIYPFAITSFGQGGPTSLILGTPTCMTGVDNSGGVTSFGITLCGVSNTGATMLVCATNNQKTISGSTSITISIVASRTATLSNELMNLYNL